MSGLEAVLVIPLILKAVESYETVQRRFVAFFSYFKELREFRTSFELQKGLFHGNCLVLLGQIDSDEAEQILQEGSHPKWKVANLGEREQALNKKLEKYLGHYYTTCAGLIGEVGEAVSRLEEEIQKLVPEAGNAQNHAFFTNKSCRSDFRRKLSFSQGQAKLNKQMAVLKDRNEGILALLKTTKELRKIRKTTQITRKRITSDSITRFKTIQEASVRLHEALGNVWSCTAHQEHAVDIGLDDKLPAGLSPRVCFNIALTFLPSDTQTSRGGPIWLEIQSSMGMATAPNPISTQVIALDRPAQNVTASLKRRLNTFLETDFTDRRKAELVVKKGKIESKPVMAADPIGNKNKDEIEDIVMSNTEDYSVKSAIATSIPINDLYLRRDLCLHLQQCFQTFPGECIGILKKTNTFQHIIYRKPAVEIPAKSVSLENVISSISQNKPISGLTKREIIRLAKALAIAVLQFNDTPWLPGKWRSRDIQFYGVDSDSLQRLRSLPVPRLKVRFPHSHAQATGASAPQTHHDTRPSPIRNTVLFALGLVLMELGFETTVRDLARKEDFGHGEDFVDYLVAQRVNGVLGTPMGTKYGEIVRKCLECEFDVREQDLAKPELQEAFYRDVICELDDLEAAFKRLDLS